MPDCSVILINYNTSELTHAAVASILQHTVKYSFEIIVVDNGSKKDDFLNLRSKLNELRSHNIKLVRSRINTGFGTGNMLGVQEASGDYYAFVNSDILLEKDCIGIMIDFLKENKNTGLVGGLAVDENGKEYKKFLFSLGLRKEILSEGFLNFINPKKYPSRRAKVEAPMKVDAAPGSFLVCRAADFDEIGGFDINLFLYYEEKDLAYRLKKFLKKDVYILPEARYIHLKGKSSKVSFLVKKELRLSQFYTIKKNLGLFKYLVFFSFNSLKYLLKSPFNSRNRKYLMLAMKGMSLTDSLRHQQKIQPYINPEIEHEH